MAINIFGWELGKKDTVEDSTPKQSIIDVESDGSTDIIVSGATGGAFVQYMDEYIPQNELDLMRTYREISLYTEVDKAIAEIVNDAIVYGDFEDTYPVRIVLDDIEGISAGIKNKIVEEF